MSVVLSFVGAGIVACGGVCVRMCVHSHNAFVAKKKPFQEKNDPVVSLLSLGMVIILSSVSFVEVDWVDRSIAGRPFTKG